MTGNVTDDGLDREIRSAVAEMWDGSAAAAPTVDEMIDRVGRRAAARPRLALAPAALVVLGLLLLIVFAVVVVGSRLPARLPTANGPIAIGSKLDPVGSKLDLVDPATGASVAFDGCAACTITDADWSPDGSTLIYKAAVEPNVLWSWTFGAAEPTRLWTCDSADCVIDNPTWSPDGGSIITDTTTADFRYSTIQILDRDGSVVRGIPSGAFRAIGWPSWMPDGRILFTAFTEDTAAISTMAADGTDIRTVLTVQTAVAAVSPDGGSIAYLSVDPDPTTTGGVATKLWVFDNQGLGTHPVPRVLWQRPNCCVNIGAAGPEWSPDGTKIALVAVASAADVPADSDAISLLTVDVVTGSADVLTKTSVTRPAWRPVP
jgi:hypothetical protein